jgi:phenylacetate-CoA ligase
MFNTFAYHHSPIWAQESFIALKAAVRGALREGRTFDRMASKVEESQWWSPYELADYQARTLQAMVSAASDVPFYRERYGALGLDATALSFPEDIVRLPFLTRDDLRTAGKRLLTQPQRRTLVKSSTSGTSGTPLELHQDLAAINRENAFIWRQLTWAGLRRGERRAWMRGDMIVPSVKAKPPHWRFNRAENMLMLSSYHLSPDAVRAYLDALVSFDPVVIQAYPSAIGFVANWMQQSGIRYGGKSLRGIVTSSESLPRDARETIESAFHCRVFDWYGQGERVAAIGTCERGHYHLLTDYSFVELLPADNGWHEIVGTGFNNWAMPLIRYRCGDFVRPATGERCPCGRSFPLIAEVQGRVDDCVKLPDGRSIGRLDHIFKGLSGIVEAQIRQDQIDAVTVLVVPAPSFNDAIRDHLVANARERLGPDIGLDVKLVDAVPRTARGKLKGVVCNV